MSDQCLSCAQPIEQLDRGRPRRWCTDCRPRAQKKAPRPAVQREDQPCAECGVPTPRMYCSQYCKSRSKRVPCAGTCGGLVYLGRGSLPAGQARCRTCRAVNRDDEQIAEAQRARVRAALTSPCADCAAPSYGLRCRKCEDARRGTGSPDPGRKLLQARRADRDKMAPGIYTPSKRLALRDKWKRQGKTCLYCGDAPVMAVDHVLPLALGGTNHEGNLAPACHECNRMKQDNLLSAWRYGVKVRRWRVPVAPRMPRPRVKRERRVRPSRQLALVICDVCGALTQTKTCSPGCHKIRMRNRYRARVGIPLDAPLYPSKAASPRYVVA